MHIEWVTSYALPLLLLPSTAQVHLKDTFAALWSRRRCKLSAPHRVARLLWINTHTHSHRFRWGILCIGVDICALMCINSFRLQPRNGVNYAFATPRKKERKSISCPGANIYWPPLIYVQCSGGAPHSIEASGKAAAVVVANWPQAVLPAVTKERNMCGKLSRLASQLWSVTNPIPFPRCVTFIQASSSLRL